MNEWEEKGGLAFKVDASGKRVPWREYCAHCRMKTQIRIEEGTCGPAHMAGGIAGSSALALSVSEVVLDNRVHYAHCSVCDWRSPLPLEFR